MTLTEFELKEYDLIITKESKEKKESYLKALEIIERKAREQRQTTNGWIKIAADNILETLEIFPDDPLEKLLAIYQFIESKNGSLGEAFSLFCKEIGDLIDVSEATLCNHCHQRIFRSQPYKKFGNVRYHLDCYQEFLLEDKNYLECRQKHFLSRIRSAAE